MALNKHDWRRKSLPPMDQIHDHTKPNDADPHHWSPVRSARSDGHTDGEAAEDDGKGRVGECERVDGETPSSQRPASGGKRLVGDTLEEHTADGDHVGA